MNRSERAARVWRRRVERIGRLALVCALCVAPVAPAVAQTSMAQAPAQIMEPPAVDMGSEGLSLALMLSRPVPYRVRLLPDPPAIVLELRGLDPAGIADLPESREAAGWAVTVGPGAEGWTRLTIRTGLLMGLAQVGLAASPDGRGALLSLRLAATTPDEFERQRLALDPASVRNADSAPTLPARPPGPLRVALDPGHGGNDRGAGAEGMAEGLDEADLVLEFARELAAALRAAGGFEIALTRSDDTPVTLDTRLSRARAAGAEVLLSLHAEAAQDAATVSALELGGLAVPADTSCGCN